MEKKEKLFQFPCSYPLKVMGRNTNEFYSVVSAIIEKHVTRDASVGYSSRLSSGEKYMAVTATLWMESEEQLSAIYEELNNHELVLMTL